MLPHNYHAPGLPLHYQRIFKKKPHVCLFRGADVIRCSCGVPLDDERQYRAHIQTKWSYLQQEKK